MSNMKVVSMMRACGTTRLVSHIREAIQADIESIKVPDIQVLLDKKPARIVVVIELEAAGPRREGPSVSAP